MHFDGPSTTLLGLSRCPVPEKPIASHLVLHQAVTENRRPTDDWLWVRLPHPQLLR